MSGGGSRTENEERLQKRALNLEDNYFKDMMVQTHVKHLTRYEYVATGKTYHASALEDLDITIDDWRFVINKDLKGCLGRCTGPEKLIEIHPDARRRHAAPSRDDSRI